jgi:hypothetical protein
MARRRAASMLSAERSNDMRHLDTEGKFLAIFYSLLGGLTSLALLVLLATQGPELAAMLVVVVAMFAMMGVLLVALGRDG